MARLTRVLVAAVVAIALNVTGLKGAPPAVAAGGIVMYADSAPGDALGGGTARVYTMGSISVHDEQWTYAAGSALGSSDWWDVAFVAPTGQVLTPGATYQVSSETPTTTKGGMSFFYSQTGACAPTTGSWFTVHEVGGMAFAVTFEYRCLGSSASLFGFFGNTDALTDVVALTTSTNVLSFADIAVGGAAPQLQATITSRGSIAATISSVTLGGAGSGQFAIESETCTAAPIPPGESCSVTVSFSPSLSGKLSASLVLDDDTVRGSRSIALRGVGTATTSAVTWGTRYDAGPNYTWSYKNGLARTATSTTSYLHSLATTDRVAGTWAKDTGPYLGVMYTRGNSSGSTWGTPVRVNSSTQHGDRAVIAAAGKYVYVAWVRLGKVVAYNPASPRTLYFRVNSNHGGSASWGARLALTSTTGRVDFPSIAASGALVYVAYTDSANGNIQLAVSLNRGATWTRKTIGTTSRNTADGYSGLPSVAAAGTNVVVSWLSDGARTVQARVSTNSASSWGTTTTIGNASASNPTAAARDSRMAVGWTAADGARVRTYAAGVWGATREVGTPYGLTRTYASHSAPALAFGAAGQIGIAWSACWNACATVGGSTRSDLVWAESKNGGGTWYRTQLIADANSTSARRVNDSAAVAWPSSTKRMILWNGYTLGTLAYRMSIRTGSGAN